MQYLLFVIRPKNKTGKNKKCKDLKEKKLSIIIPLRPGSEVFLQWGQKDSKWQKARKSLLGVKTFMQLLGTKVKMNPLYHRQLYQDISTAKISGNNLDLNVLVLWHKILRLGATFTAQKNY